jgi:hypothetical protein
MKCLRIPLFLLAVAANAISQTGTAAITGTVLDAKTQKPVPAALVMAISSGLPLVTRNTKSSGDGAFQIHGLPAGKYSLCVQASAGQYLNPCQWNGNPTSLTLASGQNLTGIFLKLTAASFLVVQLRDAQNLLRQSTKDGRRPELTVGVWGPKGLYHAAQALPNSPPATTVDGNVPTYEYRLAVPRDVALSLFIASHELKLGDSSGVSLSMNSSKQTFQLASGEANLKSFSFTVLGLLP